MVCAVFATLACGSGIHTKSDLPEASVVQRAGLSLFTRGSYGGGTGSAVPYWVLTGDGSIATLMRLFGESDGSPWMISTAKDDRGAIAYLLLSPANPETDCLAFADLRAQSDISGVIRDELGDNKEVNARLRDSSSSVIVLTRTPCE